MHCRIYLPIDMVAQQRVPIDAEQTTYLRQVMRLHIGDKITVFNGLGGEYLAELTHLSKNEGECKLLEYIDVNRELPCQVHIIQAANRSEKIETVLQKATEMGAASFQIVNSERATLNVPSQKREKRLQRWQKIVVEAAEQSERTAMPTVTWCDKLAHINPIGDSFVLHPRDAMLWIETREHLRHAKAITLAIGPEGGWSKQELEFLATQGFKAMTFGQRIMRTETAAPAMLAAIQAIL